MNNKPPVTSPIHPLLVEKIIKKAAAAHNYSISDTFPLGAVSYVIIKGKYLIAEIKTLSTHENTSNL